MDKICTVSKAWTNKRKSNLVKSLMLNTDFDIKHIAKLVGYSEAYFNNKLQRDSFSFENILAIAYACGFEVQLCSDSISYIIDFKDFLDDATIDRIENDRNENYKTYLLLKEKIKDMEEKYGYK